MRLSGHATLQAPVEKVWEALLDPAVLVRTIPGCERLETVGEHEYAMTVTVGVAAVRGTYAGTCLLHDLVAPTSLRLTAEGSGAPGTIAADVEATLHSNEDGTTSITYECQMVVGGMIAGVGQRMLGSVSRRLTGEFLKAVDEVLLGVHLPSSGEPVPVATSAPQSTGAVYQAPAPAAAGSQDFLRGVAVGAGLVTLGVLLGTRLGRRR